MYIFLLKLKLYYLRNIDIQQPCDSFDFLEGGTEAMLLSVRDVATKIADSLLNTDKPLYIAGIPVTYQTAGSLVAYVGASLTTVVFAVSNSN